MQKGICKEIEKIFPSCAIITQMQFIEKILFPSLSWIQLEISGLCNAKCFYCPHTVYKEKWKGRNFTFNEFLKIVPYLKKVKLLYLQGWGEPFCNPEFFDILKLAKENNCSVGTTTNGMLLDYSHLEKIVKLKLDIIAFSLAGIEKNNKLREGTKIEKILECIKALKFLKEKHKSAYPRINIAYMLLKSNLEELEKIPYAFKDKGIDDIVISLLDFIPDAKLSHESIVPQTVEEFEFLKKTFLKIKDLGKKNNLNIYFNLAHPFKKGFCSEKPIKAFFINSLGYVSPCVFKGIPSEKFENLYFGNIQEKDLLKIWREKDYKSFRKIHSNGLIPFPCENCNKLKVFLV